MFGQVHDAAPNACAASEAVEPGNRVARLIVDFEQGKTLIEPGSGLRAGNHHRAGDGYKLQLGFEDDSGQAHAAAGGPEKFRTLGWAAAHDLTIGEHQA